LTNLETNQRKLLQVILIGQPELRGILARPELEQLAQRVVARFHLEALSEEETSRYIRHRLSVAGLTQLRPFDTQVRRRIYALTRGVPRRINLLCDRALLGAYAAGKTEVDLAMLNQAASEVFALQAMPRAAAQLGWRKLVAPGAWVLGGLAAAALVGGIAWGVLRGSGEARGVPPSVQASASAASAVSALAAAASAALAAPASAPPSFGASASAVMSAASAQAQASADVKALIRDEGEAWRALSSMWKLEPAPAGEPVCTALARQQVQCFKGLFTLALIRQLGRPGVLTLHDDKGRPFYVLLHGVAPQSVTLQMAGVSRTMSVSALAQLWQGEFATLWRAPKSYRSPLMLGSSGPPVDALAQQLARAFAEPPPPEKTRFDDKLRARIAAFQLAQGLKPDGTAGPTTFMQLNSATGVDEPRLAAEFKN
jgi:general secretion pathway protein A